MNGAKKAQAVVNRLKDEKLHIYVVWQPIFGAETREQAEEKAALITDTRAKHFWCAAKTPSEEFAKVMELPKGNLAWDIYMLFGKPATWGETPPAPDSFLHQLTLPDESDTYLSEERLEDGLKKLLAWEPPDLTITLAKAADELDRAALRTKLLKLDAVKDAEFSEDGLTISIHYKADTEEPLSEIREFLEDEEIETDKLSPREPDEKPATKPTEKK